MTDPCYAARLGGKFREAADAFTLDPKKDAWGVGLVKETGLNSAFWPEHLLPETEFTASMFAAPTTAPRITHLLINFSRRRESSLYLVCASSAGDSMRSRK